MKIYRKFGRNRAKPRSLKTGEPTTWPDPGKWSKIGAKKGHGELHLFYGASRGTWRNGGQTPVWAKKDWNETLEKSISSPGEGNGPETRNTD